MVDIAHLLHQGEGPPQEGTHHDPVRGIATSTPTDRDPAHGQGLRGRDHDRYHRDLGVGPRCEGIEEYHDGTCCHLRGEEGGGEVPAIRVFPATVIEAAVEAEADMEGVKDDGCKIWAKCQEAVRTAETVKQSRRAHGEPTKVAHSFMAAWLKVFLDQPGFKTQAYVPFVIPWVFINTKNPHYSLHIPY